MITIGITGTIGAGKGTVVEYLKTKGFTHYSVREFLIQEIARRGLEPTRDSMRLVADDFRKNHAPGYIMEQLMSQRNLNKGNAVIESIRALAEIVTLKKNSEHFYLYAVDADPKIRYERIRLRKSSTDSVTFEKFMADEQGEMSNKEPWQMNVKACIEEADFVFKNNENVDELYKKVEASLHHILLEKQA